MEAPKPPFIATLHAFVGEAKLVEETRYLLMPHFLKQTVAAHMALIWKHDPGAQPRIFTDRSDDGLRYVAVQTGGMTTAVTIERSPEGGM